MLFSGTEEEWKVNPWVNGEIFYGNCLTFFLVFCRMERLIPWRRWIWTPRNQPQLPLVNKTSRSPLRVSLLQMGSMIRMQVCDLPPPCLAIHHPWQLLIIRWRSVTLCTPRLQILPDHLHFAEVSITLDFPCMPPFYLHHHRSARYKSTSPWCKIHFSALQRPAINNPCLWATVQISFSYVFIERSAPCYVHWIIDGPLRSGTGFVRW